MCKEYSSTVYFNALIISVQMSRNNNISRISWFRGLQLNFFVDYFRNLLKIHTFRKYPFCNQEIRGFIFLKLFNLALL